jgi:hypothetical protein
LYSSKWICRVLSLINNKDHFLQKVITTVPLSCWINPIWMKYEFVAILFLKYSNSFPMLFWRRYLDVWTKQPFLPNHSNMNFSPFNKRRRQHINLKKLIKQNNQFQMTVNYTPKEFNEKMVKFENYSIHNLINVQKSWISTH